MYFTSLIITNKNNLPAPIYNAIIANPYSKGEADISATDLIDSPQLVALREEHIDELKADASDLVYSLLGQAMHSVLERGGIQSGKGESESRLYTTINGWTLSGQFDYIDENNVLWDWKFVSTYEYIHGVKTSREEQLNVYAALARYNGYKVSGLRVGFIFRDWSQWGGRNTDGYPSTQAVEIPIPLWTDQEQDDYIQQRILLHQAARSATPAKRTPCTDAERWAKPEQWAIYQAANKRATKVMDSEQDANNFLAALQATYPKRKYHIQHRPGASTRCESYCPVLEWCKQGKSLV